GGEKLTIAGFRAESITVKTPWLATGPIGVTRVMMAPAVPSGTSAKIDPDGSAGSGPNSGVLTPLNSTSVASRALGPVIRTSCPEGPVVGAKTKPATGGSKTRNGSVSSPVIVLTLRRWSSVIASTGTWICNVTWLGLPVADTILNLATGGGSAVR